MKLKALFCLTVFLLFMSAGLRNSFAAKKFVPKKTSTVKSGTSVFPVSVRFRPDRLGILMSFTNFNGIESAAYSFTYTTNGVAQGAGGTIRSSNNPTAVRELIFGTCSTGVCRYHSNLADARLTVTIKYGNGKSATKIFRIKTNS